MDSLAWKRPTLMPNLSLNRTPLGGACAPFFGSPVTLLR